MAIAAVPASVSTALPRAFAFMPAVAVFALAHNAGSLGFFSFLAQLVDRRQIAFTHAVDKALERHIGDTHQTEVAVFTVQQAAGHRLIEVLEPMHPTIDGSAMACLRKLP